MAGDSLAERIEAVEQRLQSLREHVQAMPEQQPLLAAAAEDLGLALDGLRAARDELEQEHQERMHTKQSLRLEQARQIILRFSRMWGSDQRNRSREELDIFIRSIFDKRDKNHATKGAK